MIRNVVDHENVVQKNRVKTLIYYLLTAKIIRTLRVVTNS